MPHYYYLVDATLHIKLHIKYGLTYRRRAHSYAACNIQPI